MKPTNPHEAANWKTEKMGKATLHRSDQMMVGLNAFEPGQEHAAHAHEGADKMYLVLSVTGTFSLADESFRMDAGELLVAPAGVRHGVVNDSGERLLLLVAMAPAPPAKTERQPA